MRVLTVAAPLLGHLLPLVPLAAALHEVGHDVRVAGGGDPEGRATDLPVDDVVPGSISAGSPPGSRRPIRSWPGAICGLMAAALACLARRRWRTRMPKEANCRFRPDHSAFYERESEDP